jgi:hypothetical protein
MLVPLTPCVILEKWRLEHGNMETWRNGNMETYTWRHGNMEKWRHE